MGQTKFVLATSDQYAEVARTVDHSARAIGDYLTLPSEGLPISEILNLVDALTEHELNKKGLTIFRERATYTNAFDAEWGQTGAEIAAAQEAFVAFQETRV